MYFKRRIVCLGFDVRPLVHAVGIILSEQAKIGGWMVYESPLILICGS
jgi:hypothetical protein